MKLQPFLDAVMNKGHMVVGVAYGAGLAIYHVKTGHDLGANFVSATYAFYAFLLGHAAAYQKWPDPPQG